MRIDALYDTRPGQSPTAGVIGFGRPGGVSVSSELIGALITKQGVYFCACTAHGAGGSISVYVQHRVRKNELLKDPGNRHPLHSSPSHKLTFQVIEMTRPHSERQHRLSHETNLKSNSVQIKLQPQHAPVLIESPDSSALTSLQLNKPEKQTSLQTRMTLVLPPRSPPRY